MNRLTQIALVWELHKTKIAKSTIAKTVGVHRETVQLWIEGIETNELGITGFMEAYQNAKKGPRKKRKITGVVKEHIFYLREKYRDCCGQKIQAYLERDTGVHLSATTIYGILQERYQLKSKWKKNKVRGPVPVAEKAREVIQMDSIDYGDIYVFTGIDIYTKEVVAQAYPSLTSLDGLRFLRYAMENRYGHTELLQTDGGSEFKAEFRKEVFTYADRFRISRPYRKNEQSYIESFNRSIRKECLGWRTYRKHELSEIREEILSYMDYYHNERLHLSLDLKTPNQFLVEHQLPVSATLSKVSDF